MSMPLAIVMDRYLDYLSSERQLSPHTISNYRRDYQRFLEFSGPIALADCQAMTPRHCRQFLFFLEQRHYSRRSIARMVSALRSLFQYMLRQNELSRNVWADVSSPKIQRDLPGVMSTEAMLTFLNQLPTATPLDFRNKCICDVLYATGMRVSELVGMRLDDLSLDAEEIRVRGKGKKERIVLFGDPTRDLLHHYLQTIRPTFHPSATQPQIFLNHRGTGLTTRSVQRLIKSLAIQAGLPHLITPHGFRHACATDLLNGGANLRVVQELLGHESISTTQIYTHVSTEQLKEGLYQAHPFFKKTF